jgi:hypothetical protein
VTDALDGKFHLPFILVCRDLIVSVRYSILHLHSIWSDS